MYRLRELERKDIARINKWRNDPQLISCLGAPFRFINLDVENEWFDNYMKSRKNSIRCVITTGDCDDAIGLISLLNIDSLNQSAELHLMIGEEENQGKGAGTFAVQQMLFHAFKNINLHRVELCVLSDNTRAQRLYERCGFSREGTRRKAIFKSGRFMDLFQYSVLEEEYNPNN